MPKMVVLGSANMDLVNSVERIPGAGETVRSKRFICNAGGKGANQAVAAGKVGAEVHMIARVGRDEYGDALIASLTAAGVRLDGLERDETEPTGNAFICVADSGENNIVVYQGANGMLDAAQLERHIDVIKGAELCVMQLEIPHETAWRAVELCRENGVKVVLNPSPACAVPPEVLRSVDLLVPNEHELAILLGHEPDIEGGELCAYVRESGIKQLLLTVGAEGCYLADAQSVKHFPARNTVAVDTTGAGDCFLGTLCTMLAQSRPIEDAIKFATDAAAIEVTRMGAQQAMPTFGEVMSVYGGI